ncbi:MAG: cupin domain-containing protein [Acidimicrobiia bacterium]
MSRAEGGGDPACWLAETDPPPVLAPVVADLTVPSGTGGVLWSLPHGGDLDANLVQLGPEGGIAAHTNVELDVLFVVLAGTGRLVVDGEVHEVRAGVALLVRRNAERAVLADGGGLRYLTVHRRRDGLRIGRPAGSPAVGR